MCVYVYIHMYVRETDWLQGIGCTVVEAESRQAGDPEKLMLWSKSRQSGGRISSSLGTSVFFS